MRSKISFHVNFSERMVIAQMWPWHKITWVHSVCVYWYGASRAWWDDLSLYGTPNEKEEEVRARDVYPCREVSEGSSSRIGCRDAPSRLSGDPRTFIIISSKLSQLI